MWSGVLCPNHIGSGEYGITCHDLQITHHPVQQIMLLVGSKIDKSYGPSCRSCGSSHKPSWPIGCRIGTFQKIEQHEVDSRVCPALLTSERVPQWTFKFRSSKKILKVVKPDSDSLRNTQTNAQIDTI